MGTGTRGTRPERLGRRRGLLPKPTRNRPKLPEYAARALGGRALAFGSTVRPGAARGSSLRPLAMQKVVGSGPIIRLKSCKTQVVVFEPDYITFCMRCSMCPSVKTLQPALDHYGFRW